MICRICNEDINEKGQDNISTISGYPVCEDCKDEICCECCYEVEDLYYSEKFDKVICKDCLIEKAERDDYIHSVKTYYTDDWQAICDDNDLQPVIEFLQETMDIQVVIHNDR